ncbi:MAG: hypothetical protein KatS3mg029_0808 [Saprospiraceae bacterium]|nr:MAG: hypothetical protein KatS3mg029_0808 [Saprospiraceae bacterium]
MRARRLIFLLLTLMLGTALAAQQRRFDAGLLLGLNASQILGDDSGGYNKLGLQGGLRGIAHLTEKADLYLELTYSQRGSYQKEGSPVCFDGSLKINLQYVEVPVVLAYRDWYIEDDDYYKVAANIGFSYGRLLSASAQGSCHDDLVDQFNKNDFSFTIGAEYYSSPKWSFGVRWSKSFNLLYNNKNNPGRNSLRGFFLSFRSVYSFGK